eukprot:206806-Amphidinium_carterae.1
MAKQQLGKPAPPPTQEQSAKSSIREEHIQTMLRRQQQARTQAYALLDSSSVEWLARVEVVETLWEGVQGAALLHVGRAWLSDNRRAKVC